MVRIAKSVLKLVTSFAKTCSSHYRFETNESKCFLWFSDLRPQHGLDIEKPRLRKRKSIRSTVESFGTSSVRRSDLPRGLAEVLYPLERHSLLRYRKRAMNSCLALSCAPSPVALPCFFASRALALYAE